MNTHALAPVDFALFSVRSGTAGKLLGWEVMMLRLDRFPSADDLTRNAYADASPLLVAEATEFLEGPLSEVVVGTGLTLWMPIALTHIADDIWIDGLLEHIVATPRLAVHIVLLLHWEKTSAATEPIRRNIQRLGAVGVRTEVTSTTPPSRAEVLLIDACGIAHERVYSKDSVRSIPLVYRTTVLEDKRRGQTQASRVSTAIGPPVHLYTAVDAIQTGNL